MSSPLLLLGPQRRTPTLRPVLDQAGLGGRLALVTAGWEEREDDDGELSEHLGGDTVNLRLFERAETVFAEDQELWRAMRDRFDTLRTLQDLYRARLSHALEALKELSVQRDSSPVVEQEIEHALEWVRRLDTHHLSRVRDVHQRFRQTVEPHQRTSISRHRDELQEQLSSCSTLAIAGGHVLILLNRLALFGVLELWGAKPLVAWSAGAMALGDRVVLFHDSPPQGPGNAEVFEVGLARTTGVVPLPHASTRLRLDDQERVQLLTRRLAPARCITLDDGASASWTGGRWDLRDGARDLSDHTMVTE